MQKTRSRSKKAGPPSRPSRQQEPQTQPAPPPPAPTRQAKRRPEPAPLAERQPEEAPAADCCGCDFTFNIKAAGDIHINNYCAPPPTSVGESGTGEDGGYCRPADGTCIPVVAGAKHKQSRAQKMAERAARSVIPSVIAASTMHAIRRYIGGASPANALEQRLFATLARMPKAFLRCTVDGLDSIPPAQRAKLFAPLPAGDEALDLNQLATDFAKEIRQRAALALLGDPLAAEGERPGQQRLIVPSGEFFDNQVRICRINELRTAHYRPALDPGQYLPAEYQQLCTISILSTGEAESLCELQTADCPGNVIGPACARVVNVAQGDSVTLEGVNFYDVEAKIRLAPKDSSAPARDIDGFVWGDVDTPLEETIGSDTLLVRDCRVHDQIIFEIPKDLPANLYTMQVVIQNNTGNPAFGAELVSNVEYLNVLPPPDARYQIAIKKIVAHEETYPTWAGSDEVGLRTVACAMDLAGEEMNTQDTKFKEELDGIDFDSGTHRDLNKAIFTSDGPFLGVVIAIWGHEIDSEAAYNRQLDEWADYFMHLLEEQRNWLLSMIGAAEIKWLGWKGLLIGAALAGVVVVFDMLLALWGPADPIIDDMIDLSVIELDQLVSPSTPIPPFESYASEQHLRVNVNRTEPPAKLPYQYSELREYLSAPEMSRYELTLQYNRLN